jgi:metal-sulfur cluster biosynthetic enzyme
MATQTDTGLTREIRRVLDEIHDPCSVSMSMPMGLDEMGLVKEVRVTPAGHVDITLRLTSPFCEMVPFMKGEAISKVAALDGVTHVEVKHDGGLDWGHDLMAPQAQERRRRRLEALRGLTEQSQRQRSETDGSR